MRAPGSRGREEGQTITEYAVILATVAALVMLAVLFLGGRVETVFHSSATDQPKLFKPPARTQCDPSYVPCVPPPPPNLSCDDIRALGIPTPVQVVGSDPYGLDPDGDGLGCD